MAWKLTRLVAAVCLFTCAVLRAADSAPLTLPLAEKFESKTIAAEWKRDLSKENAVVVRDGELVITAHANTFAHLQRPLNINAFRATMAVQTDGSSSWSPGIFLYWDPSNWTQVTYRAGSFAAQTPYVGRRESGGFIETFGLLDQDMGQFYRYSIPDGQIVPKPPARDAGSAWRYVGVEINATNVRALISEDGGKTWTILREMPRDNDVYRTPPKLLIIGKGMSDPPRGLAKPDLNNDHRDPGGIVESRIKDLHVVALEDVAGNPARPSPVALRDELGEKILAAKEDPSFDAVAGIFPAMKYCRELIGVKDHKNDFTVLPDGAVHYSGGYVYLQIGAPPMRFGTVGEMPKKRLHHGHLPIVLTNWEHEGLKYEQCIFAHSDKFGADAPIFAHMRMTVSNASDASRDIHIALRQQIDALPPIAQWDLSIPAAGSKSVYAKIPYPPDGKVAEPSAEEFDSLLGEVSQHWEKLLNQAGKLDVPEPRVNDAYRAWLAYNFLDVDKIDGVYHPQDNSAIYPAVFGISAALYCRTLDDYGYHDDARRYLESLLTFVQPDGTFIVNYGLPDAGALLMAIAHHYHAIGDADWLKSKSAITVKIADRFLARRLESRSKQQPTDKWYGMVFEQPYCDYTEKAYNFVADLTLAGGLLAAGDALRGVGVEHEAERFRVEGEAYRRDILAAMNRSVIERDGQKIIPMFPQTHALLKAANYTAIDYYGLQAGQILEKGLIDPKGWEAKTFVDMLEKRGGLTLGMCRFAGGIDHAYTYGYWLNCLQRDDVKRVLLGFYSSLAYGMTRETYSGVEVTFLRSGANYPTLPHLYSGSQQLGLLRAMLLYEEGDNLMLCPAMPRDWLRPGKRVSVSGMSTRFGDVSYSIDARADGTIAMILHPPKRQPPASIHLRIRHPQGKAIKSVLLNGQPLQDVFGEMMTLQGVTDPCQIEAKFE